jgi:hypothetical protein
MQTCVHGKQEASLQTGACGLTEPSLHQGSPASCRPAKSLASPVPAAPHTQGLAFNEKLEARANSKMSKKQRKAALKAIY